MAETEKELAGRVALVTGAGRNIGRSIAHTLANAGAAVVVNGRTNHASVDAVVGEIEAQGGKALAAMADVTDEGAVERMMVAAIERFGRIDILVNNAAGRPEKALRAMPLADWRDVLATILDGAFLNVKAALPHLKRSGAGAIINIGGVSGHVGTRHRAHVVTAKAGLIGLTKALAHDLAQDKVTANCVMPGLIETARDPSGRSCPSSQRQQDGAMGRLHAGGNCRGRTFPGRATGALHHGTNIAR